MTSSTASLSSFEEFYADWYPRAVRAARKRGLSDPEAVANDIMMVFLEKDYLERYDPTRDGAVGFESWVNSIVYHRLNNAYRDLTRCPQTVAYSQQSDTGAHDESTVEFELMVMSAFELLRDRYGMEIADIWVSIVKQVVEDSTSRMGDVRRWLTAKHLRIKPSTVSDRVIMLRGIVMQDRELREMLGADCWSQQAV
jgi:hypothetical protein